MGDSRMRNSSPKSEMQTGETENTKTQCIQMDILWSFQAVLPITIKPEIERGMQIDYLLI